MADESKLLANWQKRHFILTKRTHKARVLRFITKISFARI